MRVTLLNPPYKKKVQRRFVASYFAPNFLIPPIELMGIGSIVNQWKNGDAVLIDAIAENWDQTRVVQEIERSKPDIVVIMFGFNTFPSDIKCANGISDALPDTRIVGFGYLPSQSPQEILGKSKLDLILIDEPELSFSKVYDAMANNTPLDQIDGIAFRKDDEIIVRPPRERIQDLDALPFPDHSLVDLNKYNESFFGGRIGTIMSERGCPYKCIYCVQNYGNDLVARSAENILQEIEELINDQGVSHIRFLDDTFTLNRDRLKAVCSELIKRKLGIQWTCLTRVDALDEPMLKLMEESGCRRMYLGIESGSQKVLDYYKKGLQVETTRENMKWISKSGIETSGFFIVGAPGESDEEFEKSIALAKEIDLDFIIVTQLQYWPGREIFEKEKDNVEFDLFSESNWLYKINEPEKIHERQKKFYREFYLRKEYILKSLRVLARTPTDVLTGFFGLLNFLFFARTKDDFI